MTSPLPKPRWQNPFISKLNKLDDIIFTCSREQPEVLLPKIAEAATPYKSLIVELCCGSGGHLIELASQNPDALCIGVELRFKRLVRTAEKSKLRGITNLRLMQVDAQDISKVITKESCNQIFINFPDPWDGKTRWEDKYLLSKEYLGILHSLLKPSASFHHKTDHQRRFNQVYQALEELNSSYKIIESSENLHISEFNKANILTEFERLFSSQKKPVFYLKANKMS
jgi:tRNA (guanine-N7-)-methyltransferase